MPYAYVQGGVPSDLFSHTRCCCSKCGYDQNCFAVRAGCARFVCFAELCLSAVRQLCLYCYCPRVDLRNTGTMCAVSCILLRAWHAACEFYRSGEVSQHHSGRVPWVRLLGTMEKRSPEFRLFASSATVGTQIVLWVPRAKYSLTQPSKLKHP